MIPVTPINALGDDWLNYFVVIALKVLLACRMRSRYRQCAILVTNSFIFDATRIDRKGGNSLWYLLELPATSMGWSKQQRCWLSCWNTFVHQDNAGIHKKNGH
jgi:hypothetical protein